MRYEEEREERNEPRFSFFTSQQFRNSVRRVASIDPALVGAIAFLFDVALERAFSRPLQNY